MKNALVLMLVLVGHRPAFGSACGRWLAASAILINLSPAVPSAAADEYAPVATQAQRRDPASGWVIYPDFPHLELVDPRTGVPNEARLRVLTDAEAYDRIKRKAFTELDVRNLGLYRPRKSSDAEQRRTMAVSLRYRTAWSESVCPNGTINIDGLIQAHVDGGEFRVTVAHFHDSNWAEELARDVGCNRGINLSFAKNVVVPTLEAWFNEDPGRIHTLLDLTGTN